MRKTLSSPVTYRKHIVNCINRRERTKTSNDVLNSSQWDMSEKEPKPFSRKAPVIHMTNQYKISSARNIHNEKKTLLSRPMNNSSTRELNLTPNNLQKPSDP
jgi:hypothetical protein